MYVSPKIVYLSIYCLFVRLLIYQHYLFISYFYQAIPIKKKVNIPICDVGVDPDYEKNVSASFTLPNGYLRHSKKIGDEVDISIDYNMDSQDIVSTI